MIDDEAEATKKVQHAEGEEGVLIQLMAEPSKAHAQVTARRDTRRFRPSRGKNMERLNRSPLR